MKNKIKILLVDDDWDFGQRTKRRLETEKFGVECALNCNQAIEIIGKDPQSYKVVVTDLYLPLNEDRTTYSDAGSRLAEKINDINPNIKFIALTRRKNVEEIEKETSLFSLIYVKDFFEGEIFDEFIKNVYSLAQDGVITTSFSKIFIGSSSEAKHIAHAIQRNLSSIAEITVWDQDVFLPGRYILQSLQDQLKKSDYAIFVFANDDIVVFRGKKYNAVRDNVIYELGLASGLLGQSNVFFTVPHGIDVKLPTDLLGLVHGGYEPNRSDKNFAAAVSPFCDMIREIINK